MDSKIDVTEQIAQQRTHVFTVSHLIYEKGTTAEEVGKGSLFNKWCQNNGISHEKIKHTHTHTRELHNTGKAL